MYYTPNPKQTDALRIYLEKRLVDACSHGALTAKNIVNVDTTSLQRSIRLIPTERSGNRISSGYIAGGVRYAPPLNDPVDYGIYQEEIYKPFMRPSIQGVVDSLRRDLGRAFSGDGEHFLT